jgi:putative ABC transport system permease protein
MLWQDLRFSMRRLLAEPGFTFVAVLTLALGIGATAAIFSVVNGLLLRPLNYENPQEIVTLLNHGRGPVSPANFLDLRSNSTSFTQLSAAEAWGGTLANNDRAESVSGLRMGDGLFQLLGVSPLLGRTLQAEDFEPGKDHVLVLSHKLWQRAFGGDSQVVGKQVTLSGEPYSIVGVMPPQFQFPPFWSTRAEMWAPLDLRARATSRDGNSLRVFGRLKPGVTRTQAQAEVAAINRQLVQAYSGVNQGMEIQVDALNEKVVGNLRAGLLVLSVAVGLVLLIACANVACLLLARASRRQKEAAVRLALGASRWRLLRQLLTESVLLSLCGAVVGLLLAVWGVDWLTTLLGGNSNSFSLKLPRLNEIKLDGMVLLFTFTVSILTSVLFGLAPALAASRADLNQVFKETGRGVTGGRRRLREMLVVAELALALVLLVGAGLLMNSFVKLQAVEPGFNPRNVLTMTTSLAGASQLVGSAREEFYQQLSARLAALPGVESVGAINHLPLAGDRWGRALAIEGRPSLPGQGLEAAFRVSRPNYFRTMGIAFHEGRDFTERDTVDAPGVIILNETLARHGWPNESPLGKRVALGGARDDSLHWLTIVGVVKDVKQDSWVDAPSDEIYLPFQQSGEFFTSTARQYTAMTVVVRTAVAPSSLANAVQETGRSLDHSVAVSNVVSMENVITDTLWQQRFNLQLIGLFAALALILAAIGLYGVMSYSVAQRTHEVGLRMALGAQRGDVIRMVVRQGMVLALIGVVAGLLGAFAVTRLLASLLFGVTPTDPITFAGVALGLLSVAAVACYFPARRATKVDPLVALRYE